MNRQVRHLTCSNLGLLAFGKSINDMGIHGIGQYKGLVKVSLDKGLKFKTVIVISSSSLKAAGSMEKVTF